MRRYFWKPFALGVVAFALAAGGPVAVHAQDHHDDRHDEKAAEHRDDHHDDHAAPRHDEKRDEEHRAEQYRHDHPNRSARCHDGFFTMTKDRGHACSKHGGIDIWLLL